MAKAYKSKIDLVLDCADVPGFFKKLGEHLEQGELTVGSTSFAIGGCEEFELSMKEDVAGMRIKLKVKHPKELTLGVADLPTMGPRDEGAVGQASGQASGQTFGQGPAASHDAGGPRLVARGSKPKYKALKKRMGKEFKLIRKAVMAGQMPDRALVESFVELSTLMTTYPGKGDPMYPEYDELTKLFKLAGASGDMAAMASVVEAMRLSMKNCHDRYK